MKKRIRILSMGGTIASESPDPCSTTTYKPLLHAYDLVRVLPSFPDGIEIETEDFILAESSSFTPDLWLRLARRVNTCLEQGADGIVITHGTDTMEETAYFLNLTVHSEKPVVLTGAMRPASAIGADGPLNLRNAVIAAASSELHGRGVSVCMNGVLAAARDVRKCHPTRPDAFTPVETGTLGFVLDGHVEVYYAPIRRHTADAFDVNAFDTLPDVRILYAYASAPGDLFDDAVSRGAKGLVLACVGNGNPSAAWREKIAFYSARGIVIVRCTRANGYVNRNGAWNDDEPGTVSGDNLSAQKARILLMLSLGLGKTKREIQEAFRIY